MTQEENLLDLVNDAGSILIENKDGHETYLLPDGRMVGVMTDFKKSVEAFKKTDSYNLFMLANNLQ